MKKYKALMAVALSSLMVLAAGCSGGTTTTTTTAATTAATEATTEAKTALVMATNAEFPPYEFRENDEIVGIDVEIAAAIAEHMGLTLEIEDMSFDSILAAVDSGKADMGVAGMTVNEDRLKSVDFSDTYITAAQVIIVKEGSEIKDAAGLEGKTIGVQLGTTGDIYCDDIKDATIERYNKGYEAVQALLQDKVDAVVIDDQPAAVFVQQNEGIVILEEPLTNEDYAIAVKKGNSELLAQINEAIAELKESGKLQEIFDKYISAE